MSDLSNITTLKAALSRVPNGAEAVRLMQRLGLWTTAAHAEPGERKPFPKNISKLGPDEISDLQSLVVSDAGRVYELIGILNGLDAQLKIRGKQVRAAARSRVRADWPEGTKAPTKSEVDDLAEEDPAVIEHEEQVSVLALLMAHVNATRESMVMYKEAVSREITWRGTQMQARLY